MCLAFFDWKMGTVSVSLKLFPQLKHLLLPWLLEIWMSIFVSSWLSSHSGLWRMILFFWHYIHGGWCYKIFCSFVLQVGESFGIACVSLLDAAGINIALFLKKELLITFGIWNLQDAAAFLYKAEARVKRFSPESSKCLSWPFLPISRRVKQILSYWPHWFSAILFYWIDGRNKLCSYFINEYS